MDKINSTTKPAPPAGTKTHKPVCGCIQCKAKRYDAIADKLNISQVQLRHTQDELKGARDLQDRTADDLGAAQAEVERIEKHGDELLAHVTRAEHEIARLKAENTELRTQLSQSADALQQERDASRGGMLITLTVTAFFFGLVAFLIGRFGR